MDLSQLLIAVIIYKLAERKVVRKSNEKSSSSDELYPDLEVEEYDIEAEFQAKIWTQFVREDDLFLSTVADSMVVTSFLAGDDYSTNTASQLLAHSNRSEAPEFGGSPPESVN